MSNDISGTITLGGTAQELFDASESCAGFCVQNLDATTNLYINDEGTASAGAGSFVIPPYGLYETTEAWRSQPTKGVVQIFSTKTGHVFTARRW